MMQITNGEHKARPEGLAERIYLQLKAAIFEFRLWRLGFRIYTRLTFHKGAIELVRKH